LYGYLTQTFKIAYNKFH